MEILPNGTTQYALNLADQTSDESDVLSQDDSTDLTPFLFPAIGALLMLIFGGLLFSSGTAFCKNKTMPESKIKRKFEQEYGRRTIRFHNVPSKITQEPLSVLQQENNDVVEAVKKEYQGLPQYQPISGLVSHIVGLRGQTCAVNISKPEVTHRGVSPIHSLRKENTSDYENPSYRGEGSENSAETEQHNAAEKDNRFPIILCGERDHVAPAVTSAVSSGIGTHSPTSYETDSLEEFPLTDDENHNVTSVIDETTMPNLSVIGLPSDSTRTLFTANRGVHCGGRSSVLQCHRAPSDLCIAGCSCKLHCMNSVGVEKTEIGAQTNAAKDKRLTWADIAFNERRHLVPGSLNSTEGEKTQRNTVLTPQGAVSGSLTVENVLQRGDEPLRQQTLEKWLQDVEQCRAVGSETATQTHDSNETLKSQSLGMETKTGIDNSLLQRKAISARRKMRAPIEESLQLLKRLQFVSDEQREAPVHQGGRLSCLKTVRAPSSLCLCGDTYSAHCRLEETSDLTSTQEIPIRDTTITSNQNCTSDVSRKKLQVDLKETGHVATGGRQSSLGVVRAPSGMCIHGASCHVHCQRIATDTALNASGQSNQGGFEKSESLPYETRGASVFALEQFEIGDKEGCGQELRGASAFGDSQVLRGFRGPSSFAEEPPKEPGNDHMIGKCASNSQPFTGEVRGASCFGLVDESFANTSSVTLSMAMESDTESVATSSRHSIDSKTTIHTTIAKARDNKEMYSSTTGVHPGATQGHEAYSLELCDDHNLKANHHPEAHRVRPEKPWIDPEKSRIYSEKPRFSPEKSRIDPEQPRIDPEKPRIDPEKPRMIPEKSRIHSEKPARFSPDNSRIDPEQPRIDPEQPRIDTEKPRIHPEKPRLSPEKPRIDSEKPQSYPEKSRIHPDKPRLYPGKLERNEKLEVSEKVPQSTPRMRDDEQQNCQGSDDSILKIGKDVNVMSSLLSALQRDGEQRRKGSTQKSFTPSIDKENVSYTNEPPVGNLKCSVFYKGANSSNPLLYVTVLGLEDISEEMIKPEHSVYIKVCLYPKSTAWRRTKTLQGSDKLSFKDHFIISGVKPQDLTGAVLRFCVVCVAQEERVIGQLEMSLVDLTSRDKLKRTCAIRAPSTKNDGIDIMGGGKGTAFQTS